MKDPDRDKVRGKQLRIALSMAFVFFMLSNTVSAGVLSTIVEGALKIIGVIFEAIMGGTTKAVIDFLSMIIPLLTTEAIDRPNIVPNGVGGTSDFLAMSGLIMQIIMPLVVFAILFTAIKLTFAAQSPGERSGAKNQLQNLIVGLIVIPLSPHLYQLLVNINHAITLELLGSPTVPGIYQSVTGSANLAGNLGSFYGTSEIKFLFLFCCSFIIVILAVLVIFMRHMLVLLFGVMMPLTVFLYIFDFSKSLGRKFLKYSITWALTPMIMAVWVIIAAAKIGQGSADPTSGMFMCITFLSMIIISPLIVTGALETMGAVLTSIGQLTGGPTGAAMVAAGQVMQAESAEGLVMAGLKIGAEKVSNLSKGGQGGGGPAPKLDGLTGVGGQDGLEGAAGVVSGGEVGGGGGGGSGVGAKAGEAAGGAAGEAITAGTDAAGEGIGKAGDATMKAGGKAAVKGAAVYGVGAIPGLLLIGAGAMMKATGVGVKVGGKVAGKSVKQAGKVAGKAVDKGAATVKGAAKAAVKGATGAAKKGLGSKIGGKLWKGVVGTAKFAKKLASPSKSLLDSGAKSWKAGGIGGKLWGGAKMGMGTLLNPARGLGRGMQGIAGKLPSRAGKALSAAGKKVEEAAAKMPGQARKFAGKMGGDAAKLVTADVDQDPEQKKGDSLLQQGTAAYGRAKRSKGQQKSDGSKDGQKKGAIRRYMEGGGLVGMLLRGSKAAHAWETKKSPVRAAGRTITGALGSAKDALTGRLTGGEKGANVFQQAVSKSSRLSEYQQLGYEALSKSTFGKAMLQHLQGTGAGQSLLGIAKNIGIGGAGAMLVGAAALGGGAIPVLLGLGLAAYMGVRIAKGTGVGAGLAAVVKESPNLNAFFKGVATRGAEATGATYSSMESSGERKGFVAGKVAGIGMRLGAFALKTALVTAPQLGVEAMMTGGASLAMRGAGAIFKAPGNLGRAGESIIKFDNALKGTSTPGSTEGASGTSSAGSSRGAPGGQGYLPGMEPEGTAGAAVGGGKEENAKKPAPEGGGGKGESPKPDSQTGDSGAPPNPEAPKADTSQMSFAFMNEDKEAAPKPTQKEGQGDKQMSFGFMEEKEPATKQPSGQGGTEEASQGAAATAETPQIQQAEGAQAAGPSGSGEDEAKAKTEEKGQQMFDFAKPSETSPSDGEGVSGASGRTSEQESSAGTPRQDDMAKKMEEHDSWQSVMDNMTALSYKNHGRQKGMGKHLEEMMNDDEETPSR